MRESVIMTRDRDGMTGILLMMCGRDRCGMASVATEVSITSRMPFD